MTTMAPEKPIITDRESVILSNAERRYLRRKLKGSLFVTREILDPRNQLRRLAKRKAIQAKHVAADTVQIAKNHAPTLGMAGIGALLLVARRPLSRWILQLRTRKFKLPDGK